MDSIESFTIDFPDAETTKIYSDRWLNTASILNIAFSHRAYTYGNDKFHYVASVAGLKEDVEMFMGFINKSVEYLNLPINNNDI